VYFLSVKCPLSPSSWARTYRLRNNALVVTVLCAGSLKLQLNAHTGPVFAIKYSRSGDMLLSGGMDKTAIVWDAHSGNVVERFSVHEGEHRGVSCGGMFGAVK
jgi:WD40 repeat protein